VNFLISFIKWSMYTIKCKLHIYVCFVPGLKWCDLEQCVRWMVPFAMSIREAGSSALKTFKGIAADDMHNIQTHVAYLEWLVSFIFIFIYLFIFFLI